MLIQENIALALRAYKAAHKISVIEFAEELGIAQSSLQGYLKGTANLRVETIELLAEKMDIPVIDMVSGTTPAWERTETIIRAARELSDLPSELQEEGIYHFLALVTLFTKNT